ncbi:disulfide bond formation protein B [Bordetella pseudohinzii]|uniref:Disulfide bond formation protein DsbB n=1 Tax=Bordetella pseudohinzii TaxID=1331258 RepID=A0A0J6BRW4_9BORD|nr:disulfide bond formation protein B [Bordetella pseudohinzii]ANY16023.1 disulfide bond formation protein DsbB [Bordetella pseudohinzii]KMM24584.1 disulfide bond formation protein DsbB [Bordetella pseudohinzii]KXA76577.1 disulfide bond formation protein DsbB [Bordetella pseudohinzii]KXA76962.1 disulfide bond formation protein DsbB [Bordetella pseudohinzii]CUJ09240.1 Disulfide oxidoreductase [Bordetella pseudohinzii]
MTTHASPARRRLLLLIALFCFGAIGLALISQYAFDMAPCAWCVLQRLIYLGIGILALVAAYAPPLASRLGALLIAVLSACGVAAAWYQYSVASKMLSCDQTFADRFMSASGLDGALPSVFGIFATCMDAAVSVLGIEYAIWSLALFVVVFFMAIAALRMRA